MSDEVEGLESTPSGNQFVKGCWHAATIYGISGTKTIEGVEWQ